jgi:nucleotide-binding universal stress UspA family protein
MKHILVPTDFSDDARNASHYAAHLAEKFKASLTLLHAYMLPTPVSEVPYVMINAEEMQRENEEIARVEAEKLGSAYNMKVKRRSIIPYSLFLKKLHLKKAGGLLMQQTLATKYTPAFTNR